MPAARSLFATPYSLFARLRRLSGQPLALLDRLFDGADHVEGGFRQVVILAFAEIAEALDGVAELDELAGRTGEDFGDVERLRQEALDLAGAGHRQLVFFRKLVDAENGDDVLQRLVALQHLLDLTRGVVVLLADDERREHARG